MLREELETWLAHRLRPWFAGRILPVDEEVILEWRRMVARGRERAVTFSQPDLFIAATAQVHSLTLCTRNEKDFSQGQHPGLQSLVWLISSALYRPPHLSVNLRQGNPCLGLIEA